MLKIKKIPFAALIGVFSIALLAGCSSLDKVVILDGDHTFAFGSDKLTPEGQKRIEQYTSSLMAMKEVRVDVIGHSDRIGDAKANQVLSMRRAQAVRNELLKSRLKPEQITARGVGASYPIVTCTQKNDAALIKCLAPNRRVEMKVTEVRW
ncbi:OmpA family protein [Alcaligenaceae bacterium]|nr:OmpA family protein [Alcaligenaceae bacterium]